MPPRSVSDGIGLSGGIFFNKVLTQAIAQLILSSSYSVAAYRIAASNCLVSVSNPHASSFSDSLK